MIAYLIREAAGDSRPELFYPFTIGLFTPGETNYALQVCMGHGYSLEHSITLVEHMAQTRWPQLKLNP